MENFKKSRIYPVVFMLILSFILTFLLAGLNELTLPKVELNQQLEIESKILNVFQIPITGLEDEQINSTFKENVKEDEFNDKPLYIYEENGETKAYAVPFKGPGLWGTIEGYIGVSADLNTITGIEFIDQSETPGLGARIEEDEYKNQYRDVDISSSSSGSLVESSPQGEIDQISGATQTSDAVIKMVNKDLSEFISTMGGQE